MAANHLASVLAFRPSPIQVVLPIQEVFRPCKGRLSGLMKNRLGSSLFQANSPDKSLHQLRTAMHHSLPYQESAIKLSILLAFCLRKFSRVKSN